LCFSDFRRDNKVNEFFYDLYLNKAESRLNKVRRYVYRIDIVSPKRVKKPFKARFLSLRLVKLFFLTLKYRQFRQMAYFAAAKDGLFQANFCSLLEGRLTSFVYRTNFLFSMFEIISFIKQGNVLVNNILVNYLNYVVVIGDFVTFFNSTNKFRANFFKRFKTQTILFNTPRYMFVNYKLFFAFMEKQPVENDLAYPIKLDIYRATAYY